MKINNEVWNHNSNVDRMTTSQDTSIIQAMPKNGGFALDISGKVMDNNAYGDHGRTAGEVMQDAQAQLDVSVQRDLMTVMSNSMSTEDFNKMMEEGFDPGAVDPKDMVTILDHIKATMAQSGQVVAGYNDDLSKEVLTEITGSQSYAGKIEQALKMADAPATKENTEEIKKAVDTVSGFDKLGDGSVKYMIENGLEPTIGNIYRAQFSATGDGSRQKHGYYPQEMRGYYAKKADDIDWESLKPQVEKTIEKMQFAMEEKEALMEDAKWLVEKGIPVTEENIHAKRTLQAIDFPLNTDKLIQAAANIIAEGKKAMDAMVSGDPETIYEKAARIEENAKNITDKAIESVVESGKFLNLKNLMEATAVFNGQSEAVSEETLSNPQFVVAKRQMTEIQLHMSVEVNVRMLKSGFSIDTTALSQLVDELKKQESALEQLLFPDETKEAAHAKASLYKETTSVLSSLPYKPAAVVGRMIQVEASVSLSYVHTEATTLQVKYQAAQESYEALMTAPRADMGDSIKKAFQNVDDIINDMGWDLTDKTRRGVRILGYNSLEITQENLDRVMDADLQLENVLKDMTPNKVLSLIREGKNPLEMTMDELENTLKQFDFDPVKDTEKFSRFLYQMEQKQEISTEERNAYVGMYRLFHQLEKTDYAAIGRVLEAGQDLTLGNLLTASRGRKVKTDVSVDDNFGLTSEVIQKGDSITKQISEGVLAARMAHGIYREMNMETFRGTTENTTLTELFEQMEQTEANIEADAEYYESKQQEIKEAANVDKEIYDFCKSYGIELTADNIRSANSLFAEKGNLYKSLEKMVKGRMESEGEDFEETINSILDSFTDKESAQKAYIDMTETITEILDRELDETAGTIIDIKTISMCHKQLSVTGNLAKEENYEVPVYLGETLTSINLTIQHTGVETGWVSATFDLEGYGKAGAKIYMDAVKMDIFMAAEEEEGAEKLNEIGKLFADNMKAQGKNVEDMRCIKANPLNLLTFFERNADTNNESVSTKQLYETAKEFLTIVQKSFS